MSDTDDRRDEGYSDPTAPAPDESSSTPPTTEIPLAPLSQPTDQTPDAGAPPWPVPPPPSPQQPAAGEPYPYGQPAASGDQPPYGQPPAYGDQPPYGQPPAYGEPPAYGGQPAYPPPPAYGQQPGYGYSPSPYAAPGPYGQVPQRNGSALALTIVSAITTLGCCLFTAPALILGIIALTRQSTDPESSARMARYGWIAFGVAIVLSIVAVAVFFAVASTGTFDDPGTFDGY